MGKKLYIGGLPYSTRDNDLRELFAQVGEVVSATVIMERDTGRSKGFGFVEYANAEDAQKAIEKFNGTEFGGRTITVNEARPLEERPRREGGRGSFGGNKSW